jgi:MFS family permease
VILGLATLTYAIIEGHADGWTSATILTLFALSLASFAILVPYELRRFEPLIEIRFFRSAPFSGAAALAFFAFATFAGFLLLNTLYLQDVRGYSALRAGLCTLPLAICTLVLPPISGRLVAIRGTRLPLLLAAAAMFVGPLLLTGLTVHTPLGLLFAAYVAVGIGLGLINPPITNTAISGMPPAQAGVAAAVTSTCRQVGGTIGIAVSGAIVGAGSGAIYGSRFAHATHPGWWLMVGFAAVMFIIGVLTTSTWAFATARATAARLELEAAPS